MVIVKTEMRDGMEKVVGMSIVPKSLGPRGNMPEGAHAFSDGDIPSDFYLNYQSYYILDGMLHADPGTMKL